ncbi:hypothetical protein D3C73_1509500 [compost metagenome]
MIDVATVVLVIAAHVDHRTLECVVCPLHATRFDINVTSEDDYVRFAWGGIEPSETEVQI